jgi:hypothetical protein
MGNNYYDSTNSGCNLYNSHYSEITFEKFYSTKYGYYVDSSTGNDFYNIDFNWLSSYGIFSKSSYTSDIHHIIVNFCGGGINIQGGSSYSILDVDVLNTDIGFDLSSNPTNVLIDRCSVNSNSNKSVYLNGVTVLVLENCTLEAKIYNFELYSSGVILYNTTYNQTRIKLDYFSSISLNWYLDIKVMHWNGVPASYVNLQIRKSLGTLIFNGYTDANGYIKWLCLLERTQFSHSNEVMTPYSIKAIIGNHSGTRSLLLNQSTEIMVDIENEKPVVSNLIITPSDPTTQSKLTLNYQYSDSENDQEDQTKIHWYTNGVHNSSFDKKLEIDSQYTHKGQTWYCEITPHDSTTYGSMMTSMPVTIRNIKPVASNVKILQTNPKSSDDLQVEYGYSDIDADTETRSQHRWMVNDGTGWMYSGQDTLILESSYTKKGEMWKCEVIPGDGDEYGLAVESNVVTIGNTPPVVSNPIIVPEMPFSNNSIEAKYDYYDLDSDLETGSIIKWYKNDIEQAALEGSTTIGPSLTRKGEVWHYTITPSDGSDFGEELASTKVSIGNTAPVVSNIIIGPENPKTIDDLVVTYEFTDSDGDTESFDTIIDWLRKRPDDIEFAHTGLRVKTLASSYTYKNEVWTCEITPHDGFVFGKTVRAIMNITIANSIPVISNIEILPSNPTTRSNLEARYEYSDLDNDIEKDTKITWYCNDIEKSSLNDKSTVPSILTEKGDIWYFTVQPNDGQAFGELLNSDSITVQNSAPIAHNLTLTPMYPSGDDKLVGTYQYFDEDDDNESAPEIRWYKNGLVQSRYNDILEVESNATEKGDLWYFSIRVFDGLDYGIETSSQYIIVENSKAVILSMNPAVGKVTLNETESLEFSITAKDPDGDLLLYKWKLDKTTVSDEEYYLFETDYNSAGSYNLSLTIQDVAKESFILSIEWEINVLNLNRYPELTVLEPLTKNSVIKSGSPLKFSISATDPDVEDKIAIKWYFDNILDSSQMGSSYAYVAKSEHIGERKVKVEVTDEAETVEYIWNVTVEEQVEEEGESLLGQSYDWWGLVMAIISGIVAIFVGLFGIIKMRKKKSKLKEYMEKIEEITKSDIDPRDKELELKELKNQIRNEFSQEMIVENHYIILEREIDNAIGDIRTAIIEERVAMPDELKVDVEEVLEDGVVTSEEYRELVNKIMSTKELNPIEKSRLNSMLSRWQYEERLDGQKRRRSELKREKVNKQSQSTDDDDL